MKYTIKDITNIKSGLFAQPTSVGELAYLQTRHFDDSGFLSEKPDRYLSVYSSAVKHVLEVGDVIIASKGNKNIATLIDDSFPPSVASTSFFVLQIVSNKVNPEYLCWYMNQPKTQMALKNSAKGTSIPSISKQSLENIEIEIPSLEKQNVIVRIDYLRRKEKEIQQKIEQLKDYKIQQIIQKSLSI